MAESGKPSEAPKPVEAKKVEVAKVEAPKVDAAKNPEEKVDATKKVEAVKPALVTPELVAQAKGEIHQKTKDALAKLKDDNKLSVSADVKPLDQTALFETVKTKMNGKLDVPFSKKNPDGFLAKAVMRLDTVVASLPEKDRQNAKDIFMERFFASFQDKVIKNFPGIFADVEGVDAVELTVTIENGEAKVVDNGKYEAVKQKIEGVAKEMAKNAVEFKQAEAQKEATADAAKKQAETTAGQGRAAFEKDFPGVSMFLKKVIFGDDDAKMNEAFAGGNLPWGFLLALTPYGAKSMYSTIIENKTFAPYLEKGKHELAKHGVEMRTVVVLDKPESLKSLYDGIKEGTTRTVNKPFEVKAKLKLPAQTKVEAIIFPEDFKIGDKEYKKGEVCENVVLPAGTELAIGTKFRDAVVSAGKIGESAKEAEKKLIVEKAKLFFDKLEASADAKDWKSILTAWALATIKDPAKREMYTKQGSSMKIIDMAKDLFAYDPHVKNTEGQDEADHLSGMVNWMPEVLLGWVSSARKEGKLSDQLDHIDGGRLLDRYNEIGDNIYS